MYFEIFLIAIYTNILVVYSGYPIEKCYEAIGLNEKIFFPLSFAYEITLIPKRITFDFLINIQKEDNLITQPIKFNAQLVDKQCFSSPLILPNMMTDSDEKLNLVGKLYNGGIEAFIDKFEAFVYRGYDSWFTTLEGLEGRTFLKIKFSQDKNLFVTQEPFSIQNFQKLPGISKNSAYCLKLFKSGSIIILRLTGNEFLTNGGYDHYIIKFTITNPETLPETTQIYFGETYICDKNEPMSIVKLYTGMSTIVIKFEAYDNQKRQILKAVYEPKDNNFKRNPLLSNFIPDNFEIIRESASRVILNTESMFLYQTKQYKIMCDEINYISYVDIFKSENKIMRTSSYFQDFYEKEHKIIKIKPGEKSEIDKCLQKQ